ncbi:hypothetical protein N7G274_005567 [Stereocaulon virgatum]|uniref:Uncharacterized protein n=1 Tax=Stereocaulon virgatum TaxID=373712 RepID=A0ABR4AEG1_9LECA
MRELHALFPELMHQQETSQLTNQYAQIQDRIEGTKETLKDQATRPEGSCNGRGFMLFQSRNGITRTLLGVLDIIGERIETRSASINSRRMKPELCQPTDHSSHIVIMLQRTVVSLHFRRVHITN